MRTFVFGIVSAGLVAGLVIGLTAGESTAISSDSPQITSYATGGNQSRTTRQRRQTQQQDPLQHWYRSDRRTDVRIPDFTPMTVRLRYWVTEHRVGVRAFVDHDLPYLCPFVRVTVSVSDHIGPLGTMTRRRYAVSHGENMEFYQEFDIPVDTEGPYIPKVAAVCWRDEALANPRQGQAERNDIQMLEGLHLFHQDFPEQTTEGADGGAAGTPAPAAPAPRAGSTTRRAGA